MANRWTDGQPAIDAANCARQDQLALEKRFLTKSWHVRLQTSVLGIFFVNVFYGWTRVLEQPGDLKPTLLRLGMDLLNRGKAELRASWEATGGRGRPPSYARDAGAAGAAGTLQPSQASAPLLPPRSSPLRHVPVSFSSEGGRKARYQKDCVICGQDTSYYCVCCGQSCAIHPSVTRNGVERSCLQQHRDEPTYRRCTAARNVRPRTTDEPRAASRRGLSL